jgi:hemerythrin-like domain-containing protein
VLTQIGGKRESNFTEPLGMLSDCHKRIQYFLRSLVVLAEHALDGPLDGSLDEDQRGRLETALRYFREGGPRHTADEEESLFPRLRSIDTPAIREAFAKIEDLEADHRQAEAKHREVDTIGRRWLADGHITNKEAAQLSALLTGLSRLYDRHLDVEEGEIFAIARAVLPEFEKEALGQEMARRRGILLHPVNAESHEA